MTTNETVKLAASAIIALMTNAIDTPLNSFSTMYALAERLQCKMFFGKNYRTSYNISEDDCDWLGFATIRIDDEVSMTRQITHELTHHIVRWWDWWKYRTSSANREAMLDCLESLDLEEELCREVVDTVCALPGGMQWNGKIAIPRPGVVLRWYSRKPAPAFMEMSDTEIAELEGKITR